MVITQVPAALRPQIQEAASAPHGWGASEMREQFAHWKRKHCSIDSDSDRGERHPLRWDREFKRRKIMRGNNYKLILVTLNFRNH